MAFWPQLWQGLRRTFSKGAAAGGQAFEGMVPAASSMPYGEAQAALQSAAVWACCRLLSVSVSSLPGHIFEATKQGKVKALSHPLWKLLTSQPNPFMTLIQWLQVTVLHMSLYGNAFTLPDYQDGEIVALWPLLPERVRVVRSNLVSGDWTYRYSEPYTGKQLDFQPGQLLHFRMFTLDGIVGLSPVEYHRSTISIDGASLAYAATLYRNNGRPSGVLSYPNSLTDLQIKTIRDNWRMVHAGPQNVGNIAILENGVKYDQLALPPEDMEFIEQQHFSVEQIARIYGVPPHLIGAMDKPTYASVEQQGLEFLQYTLQPIVTSIEKTIATALLEDPFYYKLNLSSFERTDIRTRYAAYATGRQWGFLSVNDIRTLEDMNEIPDGDVYLQPLNMADVSNAATLSATDPVAEPPRKGV
jgi:HK97 family phage portal protein